MLGLVLPDVGILLTMDEPLPPLPDFRGRIRESASLAATTWFQVGGNADYVVKPKDAEDLCYFLHYLPHNVPRMVIGVGSNLLVRDGGVPGVVLRLGRGFTDMQVEQQGEVLLLHAGAACLDVHVARFAAEHGIAGLEFLSGIPGTLGGAVAMNAGAYGSDIRSVLQGAEIVTPSGELQWLRAEQIPMHYRHSELPAGAIVTRAVLKGRRGEVETIKQTLADIQQQREATQPIREKTGGSTFKNPEGHKAWQLVDAAGCRGLMHGDAQVSEQHCNFMINTGNATAHDLEQLGEEVRKRVHAHSGITLEWEIKRVGVKERQV